MQTLKQFIRELIEARDPIEAIRSAEALAAHKNTPPHEAEAARAGAARLRAKHGISGEVPQAKHTGFRTAGSARQPHHPPWDERSPEHAAYKKKNRDAATQFAHDIGHASAAAGHPHTTNPYPKSSNQHGHEDMGHFHDTWHAAHTAYTQAHKPKSEPPKEDPYAAYKASRKAQYAKNAKRKRDAVKRKMARETARQKQHK